MLTKTNNSYPKQIWNENKLHNSEAVSVEKEIRSKYDQANDLAADITDELFSAFPSDLVKTDSNQWATDFINKIRTTDKDTSEQINGTDLLRKRTVGNKLWSTLATSAFLSEFRANNCNFDGQVEDPSSNMDLRNYLEKLLENADPQDIESIQKEIDKLDNTIKAKQDKANDIAEGFDNVATRNGIRKAVKSANNAINKAEQAIAGFDFGNEASSNITRQNQIGSKLMPILAQNPNMAKIGELLGRMKRIANQKLAQKPKQGTDEICGVESGNDLARMIPTEFLYMDEEFENIFISNYFQNSLTMYELKKEPPKHNGPIVCCLDSSGSMASEDRFPWAMALCLTFLHIAKKQNRDFALIHFGSTVRRVDFYDKKNPITFEQIVETANYFANDGGTDFNSPLDKALSIISTNKDFEKADIVFLTDGFAHVSENVLKAIGIARENLGLKVFSILVGKDAKKNCVESFSTEVVELKKVLQDDSKVNELFAKVG